MMVDTTEIGPELDIYIVRHGQSTANVENVLQGWADYPLSGAGILQARIAGRYLARTGIALDKIYTSPLSRARRTAEEIARRFAPQPEYVTIDGFKEIGLGSLTDMPVEEAKKEYPDFFRGIMNTPEGFDRFGGESQSSFSKRVKDGLIEVLRNHVDGDSILLTTHGGTCQVIIRELFDYEDLHRFLKVQNCILVKIERRFNDGRYQSLIEYFVTPVQQQLMLEGLGYMRGLAEEVEDEQPEG
jgi:broad specificity phosphatase PhoE